VTSARMKGLAVAALSLLTLGAHAPNQPARRALSGDLAKPLADYTGAQFAALVRPLQYGQGATRNRKCRGPQECTNGRQVPVRIDAVSDADSLGPGNLGQFGVIAARLRNTGRDMEARYNMRGEPEYTYYFIVIPAGAGNLMWVVEELDTQGANSIHRTVASGRFVGCNHPFRRGARADFYTCATSPAATGRASMPLQPVLYTRQGGPDDPPIWIACAMGCCIAES
jgi:hypothetical protein